MKLIMKWLLGLYVVVGIITMIFQVYYRYPGLFWIHGMWAKLCQGGGLVGNMAGLLGDPMELAEVKKCGSNDKSISDVMACRTKKYQ